MDLVIKVTTPGSRLSVETLKRITGTFEKVVHDSILETALSASKEYGIPADRTLVGRKISKEQPKVQYNLFIDDAKKGSWEISMSMVVGGLLAKVLYDLGIHFVKQHPEYENFIQWLNNKTSRPCSKAVEQKIRRVKKIGNLGIDYKEIKIGVDENGFRRVYCEIKLKRESEEAIPRTSRQQLAKMKHELGYDDQKDDDDELENN